MVKKQKRKRGRRRTKGVKCHSIPNTTKTAEVLSLKANSATNESTKVSKSTTPKGAVNKGRCIKDRAKPSLLPAAREDNGNPPKRRYSKRQKSLERNRITPVPKKSKCAVLATSTPKRKYIYQKKKTTHSRWKSNFEKPRRVSSMSSLQWDPDTGYRQQWKSAVNMSKAQTRQNSTEVTELEKAEDKLINELRNTGKNLSPNAKDRARRCCSRKRKRRSLELFGKYRKKKLRSNQTGELWEGFPFNLQMPRNKFGSDSVLSTNQTAEQGEDEQASTAGIKKEFPDQVSQIDQKSGPSNICVDNSKDPDAVIPVGRRYVKKRRRMRRAKNRAPWNKGRKCLYASLKEPLQSATINAVPVCSSNQDIITLRPKEMSVSDSAAHEINTNNRTPPNVKVSLNTEVLLSKTDANLAVADIGIGYFTRYSNRMKNLPGFNSKNWRQDVTNGETNIGVCDSATSKKSSEIERQIKVEKCDDSQENLGISVDIKPNVNELKKDIRQSGRVREGSTNDWKRINTPQSGTVKGKKKSQQHSNQNTKVGTRKYTKKKAYKSSGREDGSTCSQPSTSVQILMNLGVSKPITTNIQPRKSRIFKDTGRHAIKSEPLDEQHLLSANLKYFGRGRGRDNVYEEEVEDECYSSLTFDKQKLKKLAKIKRILSVKLPQGHHKRQCCSRHRKNSRKYSREYDEQEWVNTETARFSTQSKKSSLKQEATSKDRGGVAKSGLKKSKNYQTPLMRKARHASSVQHKMLTNHPKTEKGIKSEEAPVEVKKELPTPTRPLTRRQSLQLGASKLLPGLSTESDKKKSLCTSQWALLADTRLGMQACSLWSSENRRHYQLKKPNADAQQLDQIMCKGWAQLSKKEQLQFYKRAFHATADRNKHSKQPAIAQNRPTPEIPSTSFSSLDKEAFLRLVGSHQDKVLRKELMNFQRILSSYHYDRFMQEFTTTFRKTVQGISKRKPKETMEERQSRLLGVSRQLLYTQMKKYKGFVQEVQQHQQYLAYKQHMLQYEELLRKLIVGEWVSFDDSITSEKLTFLLEAIESHETQEQLNPSDRSAIKFDSKDGELLISCHCANNDERTAVKNIVEDLKVNSIGGTIRISIGNEEMLIPRISMGSALNDQLLEGMNKDVALPVLGAADIASYFSMLEQEPEVDLKLQDCTEFLQIPVPLEEAWNATYRIMQGIEPCCHLDSPSCILSCLLVDQILTADIEFNI